MSRLASGGSGGTARPPTNKTGILPKDHSSFSYLADMEISGHGKAKDKCGHRFVRGCLETHLHKDIELDYKVSHQKLLNTKKAKSYGIYGQVFRHKCNRQNCPICYKAWAARQAKKAARRIRAFKIKGRKLKPIHATVSVPHEDWDLPYKEMKKKVYRVLKNVHVLGGGLMYHPKRFSRKKGWYYSPHFHTVCYGFIQDVRKNYLQNRYVVKNLGIRHTLEGTFWYQLSHAGYKKGVNAITWYGSLYNKKKLNIPEEIKKEFKCPICGMPLQNIVQVSGSFNLSDKEEGYEFYDDSAGWIYEKDLKAAY